MDNVKQI
jgi:WD40 repeat protein